MSIEISPISIAGFPALKPVSNITPFTYRDGLTYLEVLSQFRTWIVKDLIPQINKGINDSNEAWNNEVALLVSAVNAALATQTTENEQAISEALDQVNNAVEGVNTALASQQASVSAALSAQQADVDSMLSAQQATVDAQISANNAAVQAAVDDVLNSSISLQDDVMAGILADENSDTYASIHPMVIAIVEDNPPTVSDSSIDAVISDDETVSHSTIVGIVQANAYHTNPDIASLISGAGETRNAVRAEISTEVSSQVNGESGDIYEAISSKFGGGIPRYEDLSSLESDIPAASSDIGLFAYTESDNILRKLRTIQGVKYWAPWESDWIVGDIGYYPTTVWNNPNGRNEFRHKFSSGLLTVFCLIELGPGFSGDGLSFNIPFGESSSPPVREIFDDPSNMQVIVRHGQFDSRVGGICLAQSSETYVRLYPYVYSASGAGSLGPISLNTEWGWPGDFESGNTVGVYGTIDLYG